MTLYIALIIVLAVVYAAFVLTRYKTSSISGRSIIEVLKKEERPKLRAVLPQTADSRKGTPLVRGCVDYFPAALAAVARLSQVGNDQHNPGQPLHHARSKSSDHADCLLRHLMDRGTMDSDGVRHSAKVAWRALALLQEELEREEGAPLPRGAMEPDKK